MILRNYIEDIADFDPDEGDDAYKVEDAAEALDQLAKAVGDIVRRLRAARGFLPAHREALAEEAAGGRYSAAFSKRIRKLPPRLKSFPVNDRACALWCFQPDRWPVAKQVLTQLTAKQRLRFSLRRLKVAVMERNGETPAPKKAKAKAVEAPTDDPRLDLYSRPTAEVGEYLLGRAGYAKGLALTCWLISHYEHCWRANREDVSEAVKDALAEKAAELRTWIDANAKPARPARVRSP
jgi:hypothetical protein